MLNLYSARHYQTDEALYDNFTKATGIKINRIEAGDEQLLERIKSEGTNSPADVLMIVDAARLWSAQQQGLFQPVKSAALAERIPASMRDPDGNWYGFSSRARVIVYNKAVVNAADVPAYESLADPKNKGKICTRAGQPSVQPVARRRADLPQRRSQDRGMGEVGGRQHGAHAARRRHRPDQGRRRRRMRDRAVQYLLLRAPASIDEARGKGVGGENRRRLARPGELRHARQHLRCRRAEDMRRIAKTRSSSSSISRAIRRRPTSPTATTSGPRSRAPSPRMQSSNRSAPSRPIRCPSPRWARIRQRRRSSSTAPAGSSDVADIRARVAVPAARGVSPRDR